jgi:peroxiredoxin
MTFLGGGAGRRVRFAAILVAVVASASASAASVQMGKLTAASGAAPPLELKDSGGKIHRLADYRGKVVLVNFWATWCEPCRDEMPSMQKLRERLAGKPFAILAVNHGESAAQVDAFLKKLPLEFTVLLDPFNEVTRVWKPGILPASFLIGRDGRIRYKVVGEFDWAGEDAAAAIRGLLD